jgi:hypothetical protein
VIIYHELRPRNRGWVLHEGRCNYKIWRNAPIYHPHTREMLPRPMTKRCILLLINFRGICQHAFHFIPAKSSILSSVCGLPGRGSCEDVHTLLRGNLCVSALKVHTDRTRFGNATRIFNFQLHLTSIFFYVFWIFGTTWAILAIWSAYLVKFLSVDGFICF